MVFSPDGHRLACASDDHTVQLWNADTGNRSATRSPGTPARFSVAFSPDGHRLASASSDKIVWLWNADTGEPIGDPLTGHPTRCSVWRSDPTGTGWFPAASTTPCGCGPPTPAPPTCATS